jgi:hypothetical protein
MTNNDMTEWTRKICASLNVTVEDYYNHAKVTGDDLMKAYERIHQESPQEIETTWKGTDGMAVKVPGKQ